MIQNEDVHCFGCHFKAEQQLTDGITKGSPKTEIVNDSISEGMSDIIFTCDNLLHAQILHPLTSTKPYSQPIKQTGGQSSGQVSE